MGAIVVKSLGTGQSFNVKEKLPDVYKNLTADNFFIRDIAQANGTDKVTISGYTQYIGFTGGIYKSYNASSGVLDAYNYIKGNKNGTTVKANVTVWYISDPSQLIHLGSGTTFDIRNNRPTLYNDTYSSWDLEGYSNFLISSVSSYSSNHSRTADGAYTITGYTGGRKTGNNNGVITMGYKAKDSDQSAEQVLNTDVYFYKGYSIKASASPSSAGDVTGAGTYCYSRTATLKATPATDYKFDGWYEGSTLVSSNVTYSLSNIKAAHTLVAKFIPKYTVSVEVEGQEYCQSATWSWGDGLNVKLNAVANEANGQFVAWYARSSGNNTVFITNSENTTYPVTGDTVFVAEFKQKFNVTTSVVGEGEILYTRGSSDKNYVTFSVVPAAHYTFEKYVVDSEEEITATAFSRLLTADISVEAHFVEDDKYHILSRTNIPNFDIYVSQREGYYGFTATLHARPHPGYNFIAWDDGTNDNPRTITVTEDIFITATYWKEFDENGVYQYRCYIKDQLNLGGEPKAFMRVDNFDVKRDLLTTANSTVKVYRTDMVEDIINDGDILILYDPKGTVLYQGVITSREENTFHCSQIQSFYKGEWVYDTGETPPDTYDTSWKWSRYAYPDIDVPSILDYYGKTVAETQEIHDDYVGKYIYKNLGKTFSEGTKYGAQATTYIWASRPFNIQLTFQSHQGGSYYLNGELVGELPWKLNHNVTQSYQFTCNFKKGKNELTVCYRAFDDKNGDHYETTYNPYDENGWAVYMTGESFGYYDPTATYKVGSYCSRPIPVEGGIYRRLYRCTTAITTPEAFNENHWERSYALFRRVGEEDNNLIDAAKLKDHPYVLGITSVDVKDAYLENSLKNILFDYSKGLLVGSDYTDIQVQNRFGGMINYNLHQDGSHIIAGDGSGTGSITAALVTANLGDTMDFEKFIYWLYECYGIIFDFTIAFNGDGNYVTIHTCPYESIQVGNNTHAIRDISPIETVEETNRLVIFASDGLYRKTVMTTKNNETVQDPTGNDATRNRFELTNTKIVYSDDPIEDLVAAYLPNEIYNHKLNFTLVLRNYIYEFNDFKLGMPLEVYYRHDKKQDFYNTVLTGYSMRKESGKDVTEVEFVCGLVRQKLTQKITLGRV